MNNEYGIQSIYFPLETKKRFQETMWGIMHNKCLIVKVLLEAGWEDVVGGLQQCPFLKQYLDQ